MFIQSLFTVLYLILVGRVGCVAILMWICHHFQLMSPGLLVGFNNCALLVQVIF